MTTRQPLAFALVSLIIFAGGLAVATTCSAQTLKEQIVGTWLPVSQYVDQDGKKLEPFGSERKGIVIYDADGRFVLVLQRATLPKFASSNRLSGTAEENKAIVQGSAATLWQVLG